MPDVFRGYAVPDEGKELQIFEYDAPALGDNDIEIEVTHNGLCHTDISMRDNQWGMSKYPFIPGHEVVGKVTAKGDGVTKVQIGDRVGWGWAKSSCQQCTQCVSGLDNMCADFNGLIVAGQHGGFQPRFRGPMSHAHIIPEALDSANAAPLLCAGVTVYSPLKRLITHPAMKVGVLGIGGLGHLALQFATSLASEVYALSTSQDKEDEAKKFGAATLVTLEDAPKTLAGKLDILLVTSPKATDFKMELSLLAKNGHLCFVGIPAPTDLVVQLNELIVRQLTISGSMYGTRGDTAEMLELCAIKGIAPQIEKMPLSKINEAMKIVEENKARYRIVLETDPLPSSAA